MNERRLLTCSPPTLLSSSHFPGFSGCFVLVWEGVLSVKGGSCLESERLGTAGLRQSQQLIPELMELQLRPPQYWHDFLFSSSARTEMGLNVSLSGSAGDTPLLQLLNISRTLIFYSFKAPDYSGGRWAINENKKVIILDKTSLRDRNMCLLQDRCPWF